MKTWEMIKELTENPNKEFISKEVGIFAEQKAYGIIDEYGEPTIKIVNMETGKLINSHHINRKWEKVKKPVDFMTAAKSGKRLKLINKNDTEGILTKYMGLNKFMRTLSDLYSNELSKAILTEGEFYIED